MLGSNHKERHRGDGMEVVREVDGRWKERIDDLKESGGVEDRR
jgi:hypothetical protein